MANHSQESADVAANVLARVGFEVSAIEADISDCAAVQAVVRKPQSQGAIWAVLKAAGVSPSQAPIESVLNVYLFGTSVVLEEFGMLIAEGGSGVVTSSQPGYRMPALTAEKGALLVELHCGSNPPRRRTVVWRR